jgi:hypothetical protein
VNRSSLSVLAIPIRARSSGCQDILWWGHPLPAGEAQKQLALRARLAPLAPPMVGFSRDLLRGRLRRVPAGNDAQQLPVVCHRCTECPRAGHPQCGDGGRTSFSAKLNQNVGTCLRRLDAAKTKILARPQPRRGDRARCRACSAPVAARYYKPKSPGGGPQTLRSVTKAQEFAGLAHARSTRVPSRCQA